MLLIEKILQQEQAQVPQSVWHKARQLQEHQSVLMFRLSDGFFMARVKDNEAQIHTVHSNLRQWDIKNCKCSCMKSMPCMHLLAGLMAWLAANTDSPKSSIQSSKFEWITAAESAAKLEVHLQGDASDGYDLSYIAIDDDKEWNIVDILAHLLESYDYASLMQKNDDLVLQMINEKNQKLRISWGRLKWLLQRIIDARLSMQHRVLKIKNDWTLLRHFQMDSPFTGNDAWKKMLFLLNPEPVDLAMYKPEGLNCSLRHYQLEGVAWMRRLHSAGFGGILADDMGLGKTLQTLTYLLGLKESGLLKKPALVVVPTSLLANWQDEASRFTPNLKIQLFHSKAKRAQDFNKSDLIVTSYGMVQRHRELFVNMHFSHILLDEAQLIKNFQSQKTIVLKRCQADTRFCLSGTPMENHLGELWSLMDFAVPDLLGSRMSFRKNFQQAIESDADLDVKKALLARIQPFLLRRTKAEVLTSLPKKTSIIQKIAMQPIQFELYESFRASLATKVQTALAEKGLIESRWVVLDALLKLRQICCDPRLLPSHWQQTDKNIGSAKLLHLMDMLENLLQEGRSVLVFSQFTKMLALIEDELKQRQYPYFLLTGQTQNRASLVHSFQNTERSVFLLSLKAGGLGLNLTKADTVIHYEPWWNPAVTAQATDRIHRIGQEQAVFEYHLVMENSIEQYMMALQEKKDNLFTQTIDASAQEQFRWTEEEIMKFFSAM